MASVSTDSAGLRRILFVNGDGDRKAIRLGKVPVKLANEIKLKIQILNNAKILNLPLDIETAIWVTKVGEELHAKLAAVGLVEPRVQAEPTTLGPFLRDYIESRTDVKPRTRINFEQAESRMVEFFGENRRLVDITPAEVDRWCIALKQRYAEATAARTIKRARQFFTAARRGRLVESNPFEDVKPGSMHNPERLHFVTPEDAIRLIDAAPCADWRAIIALVRFGGLRCPSEPLALAWSDIDWGRGRFLVRSPKLEHTTSKGKRWVPLFPELRPYLEDLFESAPPGAVHVITRYRDAGQNLRTTFEKIIDRAGLLSWPRLFQNLRASRETELAGKFPLHVVAAWIGNSTPVAAKHYLSVTDADFDRAIGGGAESGARTAQNPAQSGAATSRQERKVATQTQMPRDVRHPVASGVNYCTSDQMPLSGLEPETR
jgi:integrase